MYHFTFEDVCNQCMGLLDLSGGPVPANIESLIGDVNDVSTWNLAPLSPIARFYQRAIAMDSSPFSRPAGNSGFTEYAPRHVYAMLDAGQLVDVAAPDAEPRGAVRPVDGRVRQLGGVPAVHRGESSRRHEQFRTAPRLCLFADGQDGACAAGMASTTPS